MTLRVSGKNLSIGQALRTHVHTRIDGVLAKYHAGTPTGHVTIEPEGSGYRADCTLFLASGTTLQVEAIATEPYASFDKAADRIERRLRDGKKRLAGRHDDDRVAAASIIWTQPVDASLDPLDGDDAADGEMFPAVVAEHGDGFSEMTVAAAVRKLDASAQAVVIFRYAENRRINIVYRREDGNIGWIDPQGASNGKAS